MVNINIPGFKELNIKYLVSDLNGTLTSKGVLKDTTAELLNKVAENMKIFIVTADTYGKAGDVCQNFKAELAILKTGKEKEEKASLVRKLGCNNTAALGNGANDELMLEKGALGIAVMGEEGCSSRALLKADIVVKDIDDALKMLLDPDIIKAALRT